MSRCGLGSPASAVRHETVRAVRHRHDEPRSVARALPLEQRGEDLRHGGERARTQIGGLDRRQGRCGVRERARPAEVVQVVAGTQRVTALDAEARERAVDDAVGDVVRTDAETRGDPGPEALEHDVGAGAERAAELGLGLEVADDRLLARVERRVPLRRDRPQRVAVGGLEPDDAGAEAEQLAACKWARQVPCQVDDEEPRQRLHRREPTLRPCQP